MTDMHNANDYMTAYKRLKEELYQMLLPKAYRNDEYKDVFLPNLFRQIG